MKTIILLLALTFGCFANASSDVCKMRGTTSKAGVLTDNSTKASKIFIEGFGELPVTEVSGKTYRAGKVVLDLENEILVVNGVKMHLVECFHSDNQ